MQPADSHPTRSGHGSLFRLTRMSDASLVARMGRGAYFQRRLRQLRLGAIADYVLEGIYEYLHEDIRVKIKHVLDLRNYKVS